MTVDPRTPVLVGAAQLAPADRDAPTSALRLLADASRDALDDAGAALRTRIGYVGVADCLSSQLPDMPGALAADLGVDGAHTVSTRTSGTSPVELLADACTRIGAGELDAALVGGAEAVRALRRDRLLPEPAQPEGAAPARVLGVDAAPCHPGELAAGLNQPVQFYPLFENALRAANAATVADNDRVLGDLWARFAAVARDNPHAWVPNGPGADEILHAGEGNRMVAAPYRKLLTANIYVDQAAALVLCSARTAREAGIPPDDWVFVHATASANDHWFAGTRQSLHRSPAVAALGAALGKRAGRPVGELEHLDLYSCFPCAVRIAAGELGVDLAVRTPTVTGGLTFAGGPGSNYATHSLAATARALRADPDGAGLCTAVGWFLTKHAAALLSGRPPAQPYAHLDVQDDVDATPSRAVTEAHRGTATVETYTCTYDRAGEPETGYVACLLPDGSRTFAASADRDTAAALVAGDPLGIPVHLDGAARFTA